MLWRRPVMGSLLPIATRTNRTATTAVVCSRPLQVQPACGRLFVAWPQTMRA